MNDEIWKKLKMEGLEKYAISNKGRLKNTNTNKYIKPQINMHNYLTVVLYKTIPREKVKPISYRIHRLVLETFKPVENMNKLQVNHIDTNRQNNCLSNLEWTTPKENCNKKAKKEIFYNSKGCYDEYGNFFNSYREAARQYNMSPNTIKRDCLNITTRIEKYKGRKTRPYFYSYNPLLKIKTP